MRISLRSARPLAASRRLTKRPLALGCTTGEELKRLKATLVKDTPRGDNTRIGWVKAFDLEPPELPFGRRMAEMIIAVHDFFDGTQVPLRICPARGRRFTTLPPKSTTSP